MYTLHDDEQRPLILIIEDEPQIRHFLHSTLANMTTGCARRPRFKMEWPRPPRARVISVTLLGKGMTDSIRRRDDRAVRARTRHESVTTNKEEVSYGMGD
jgi:hypothetical protein